MKRFQSVENYHCPGFIRFAEHSGSKSLPNIGILLDDGVGKSCGTCSGGESSGGLKRQNSKRTKILQKTWDKVKTIIHYPQGRRHSRHKQLPIDTPLSPPIAIASESPRPNSSSILIKPFRSFYQLSNSAPSTPNKRLVFDFEPIPDTSCTAKSQVSAQGQTNDASEDGGEMDEVIKHYVQLQKRLSEELHQSVKDDRRKDESTGLSEDFKKRLQQWEMWKASTGKYQYTEQELQKLIPVEFSKKLQEWEELKTRPRGPKEELMPKCDYAASSSRGIQRTGSTVKDRKKKKKTEDTSRQKELAWLEKQLEKIDVEKKRLEREMVKYCERETRLQKMREALRNNPTNPKQEVWIKTPTAECKVEGLDEKFTKKLYKWEEKRGIQPECSTMALLNPKYFTSSPEPQPTSEVIEIVHEPILLSDIEPAKEQSLIKDYPSSQSEEESEHEYEEYEEATDSFATKDEPASGASNTDSDCFNLKPGYRRRSSDAISTPLSSARSPSPSYCTSDDDENFFLQTVNENEEDKCEEKQGTNSATVVKAKPIHVEDGGNSSAESSVAIVKTQRTIFKPVQAGENVGSKDESRDIEGIADRVEGTYPQFSLNSPTLVQKVTKEFGRGAGEIRKESYTCGPSDPPRIVGAIRKDSPDRSLLAFKFQLPPIPSANRIKDGSKPILGKIPVWCSPLMARRRATSGSAGDRAMGGFSPQTEFSIDKFLKEHSIPVPSPRPTRIPIAGGICKKYGMQPYDAGAVARDEDEDTSLIRITSLNRSSSFQDRSDTIMSKYQKQQSEVASSASTSWDAVKLQEGEGQVEPSVEKSSPYLEPPPQGSVTKSKSMGSILGTGTSGGGKGLLGFASKLVHNQSDSTKPKRQILPSWLKHPSNP